MIVEKEEHHVSSQNEPFSKLPVARRQSRDAWMLTIPWTTCRTRLWNAQAQKAQAYNAKVHLPSCFQERSCCPATARGSVRPSP